MAAILSVAVGTILAGYWLSGPKTLSSRQRAAAQSSCAECHPRPAFASADAVHVRHAQVGCTVCHPEDPPEIDLVACNACHRTHSYHGIPALHDTHASLNCSRCHGESGLEAMDRLHDGLGRAGLGAAVLCLAGLVANFIVAGRRAKAE